MQSTSRRGGRAVPGHVSEDEETTLLGRLESVSKAPETHAVRPGGVALRTVSWGARRGRAWACIFPVLAACGVAAVAVGGYLVVFCVFWARHVESPAFLAWSLHDVAATPGADFRAACSSRAGDCVPFFFGLATAPAHVEDHLNDSWLDFAREVDSDGKRRVAAWANAAVPDQRLRFWMEPEVEVQLAADTGIDVLRLGVDWGRIVPLAPPLASMGTSATLSVVDWAAVERYKEILVLVKSRGLRVMLTLFHHSLPKWGLAMGGWTNPDLVTLFLQFSIVVAEAMGPQVDFWVTFNEPSIFVMATHCWCNWPPPSPGHCPRGLASKFCVSPWGAFGTAMKHVADAHNAVYPELRRRSSARVGVAHSVAVQTPFSALDLDQSLLWGPYFLYSWIDAIGASLDFCGLNYYGQEFASLAGLHMVEGEEYSEAGRAVYPDGLFKLLLAFHQRYRARFPLLRYVITENGIADANDVIRRVYLVEHLLALHAAIAEGVPVDGYIHWTISDNWEWADGYCPKFGLVEVDRKNNLTRLPRPSYNLFKQVVRGRAVTGLQRQQAWDELQAEIKAGHTRPVCRYPEPSTLMAPESLDSPVPRNYSTKDWRFGKYRHQSIATMLFRVLVALRAKFKI